MRQEVKERQWQTWSRGFILISSFGESPDKAEAGAAYAEFGCFNQVVMIYVTNLELSDYQWVLKKEWSKGADGGKVTSRNQEDLSGRSFGSEFNNNNKSKFTAANGRERGFNRRKTVTKKARKQIF